jgi:hypothetical protein
MPREKLKVWRIELSLRLVAIFTIAIAMLCLALPNLAADSGWSTAARYFIPLAMVGILPGLMAFVWFRPSTHVSPFDLIAVSSGVSLVGAQIISFLAVGIGFPAESLSSLFPVSIAATAGLFMLFGNKRPSTEIVFHTYDLVILGGLVFLVAVLYKTGNNWFFGWVSEDHIHLAVIRRLLEEPSPWLDRLYFVKDFIYTYPFPGIHYFYALTSVVADLDPIFVYDKMSTYWSLVALTTLYAFTSTVFRSRRVAVVTLSVALSLTLLGPFARIPGFYWGQLAPVPHVSDVAMNVILPLLLLFSVRFLDAKNIAVSRFYFTVMILMMVMLSAVHAREFVQFVIYMIMALVALVTYRRAEWRRGALTLVATILIFGSYYIWYKENVANITNVVSEGRRVFEAFVLNRSFSEFFFPLRPYASGVGQTMFYGLGGLMMLVAPIVAMAFRRRPYVIMMFMSIVAYLAIIRIGAFSVPYIYFTYDEILASTMRNIIFFCYVMLGGGSYWLAWRLNRLVVHDKLKYALLSALCASASIGLFARLLERAAMTSNQLADLALLIILILSIIALVLILVLESKGADHPILAPLKNFLYGGAIVTKGGKFGFRGALLSICLVLPVAVFLHKPDASLLLQVGSSTGPVTADKIVERYHPIFSRVTFGEKADDVIKSGVCRSESVDTPSADQLQFLARDGGGTVLWCMPSIFFVTWLKETLGPDAVLMINPGNAFQAIPFYRGRLVVPVPVYTLRSWNTVLPEVAQVFKKARAAHGGNPVYNGVETANEKYTVLKALGATHFVVDPMYYPDIMTVVEQRADLFNILYDEQGWAVVKLL